MKIEISSLDTETLAPIPEVHSDYLTDHQNMFSRLFFTSAGKWKVSIQLSNSKTSETQSFVVQVKNQNFFPKDTQSFPYVGKKAHGFVGILGGSGCRRRWDFVDTHDSLHLNMPYDLCGKYALVSNRYHKWVDLSRYGHKAEKYQIMPIKGDAVLEELKCKNQYKVFKLIHYPICGQPGQVIAYCDPAGNDVSKDLGSKCSTL